MSLNIYLDRETRNMIDSIRNRLPSFNVSQFFKKSLGEQLGTNTEEKNVIDSLQRAKEKVSEAESEVNFWQDKIYKLNLQKELKNKEIEEEKIKEIEDKEFKIELEKIGEFADNNLSEYLDGVKNGLWFNTKEFFNSKNKK